MRRIQRNHRRQRLPPRCHRLFRKREEQIDVDVIKPKIAGEAITVKKIGDSVDAAELLQHLILHRLQTETEPIHPGIPHCLQLFRVNGAGIAFHGNFRIRTNLEMRT